MNIHDIIDELLRLNISLQLDNGELKLAGARGNISAETVNKIREHKALLIDYLNDAGSQKNCRDGFPSSPISIRHLDFSIFYFGNAGDDNKDIYKMFIDGARHADDNGYVAVWTPERHFNKFGGIYPNPSVLGAALATITRNISIRAGSVVVPLHDPIRIVEEWSVIDNLSGGRVGIASASGWHPNDFVLYPERYKERQAIMYRNIETIRKLWRGEAINLKDGNDVLKETKIYPAPVQNELPLWITSSGNIETFISAGKLGLNILTHLLSETVEELSVKIEAYRKAYRESGLDESNSRVTLMLHTFIGEDDDDTYAKAKRPFINYLKSSLGLSKNRFVSMGYNIRSEKITDADMEEMFEYSFSRYISGASLIGTKETAKNMLYKLSGIGVNEVACLIDFGIDHASTMNGLSRLTALKDRYNLEVEKNNGRMFF